MTKSNCVCVFSNFYTPVVSGSSTQVEGLCRELAKFGWEVVIISARASEKSPEYEIVNGVHIYRLPSLHFPKILSLGFNFSWLGLTFTPANIKRIKNIIQKHQPNILHLHNYMFDLALSAAYMQKYFNLPMVLTIHTYLRHPSKIINAIFYSVEQLFLKGLIVRKSNCVICPDMNVVNYSKSEFGDISTALIPYGINLSSYSNNTKENLQKRFNLKEKRVILSVGHLHAMRNRKDLFFAMPQILSEIPNAVLMIVGDVSIPLPEELLKNDELGKGVIFTGSLQHNEVSALLGLADLEAHWLNQYEPGKTSLGIASLEAMSAGVTILAAANPDTYGKGILKDGENVVMVEPNNPDALAKTIVRLLRNDTERRRIGDNAQQTIKDNFLWDSVCEQTIRVYNSVIKST